MIDSSARQPARLVSPSLARACLALTAIVLVALAAIGEVARQQHGAAGLQAAGVAAITCWLSTLAALLLAGSLRRTSHAVSGILGGTLLRTLVPLAVAAGFQAFGGPLARAGLFGYMVLFFLLTLTIETLLLVWLLRPDLKTPAAQRQDTCGMGTEGGCINHG